MIYDAPQFKTGWLSPGDIIHINNNWALIHDTVRGLDGNIQSKVYYIDFGTLEPVTRTILYTYDDNKKHTLSGKAYMNPFTKEYQHHKLDDCESYGVMPVYADVLSKDNPLGPIPYWNDPGGKNLTILHCLEWALLHLKNEHSKLPCQENEETIVLLTKAIEYQQRRRKLREEQGVLGTNRPHNSL
jgi:hypothetical protein